LTPTCRASKFVRKEKVGYNSEWNTCDVSSRVECVCDDTSSFGEKGQTPGFWRRAL
jgi:hypothetical protein